VSLLTWDPESEGFWLIQDYFPELLELDRAIFPTMKEIQSTLGAVSIKPIPIPADCVDGFLGAYWQRPSAYLDAKVRSGMSSFSRIPNVEERVKMLQQDIVSGAWQRRHASLRLENSLDIGYRLVSAAIQ
ncbi:MAG TPA: hypothetical protein VFW00_01680, partial [Rhodocyclaceae bacterium]|nr:hypothetical protein [Rhodocyclaceae bacterium]